MRRSSSASRELKASPAAGSQGNSSPGISCSSSSPRSSAGPSVAVQVAALDERDRVRQIGEREAVREPRAVGALGGVGGRDELARGAAAQASSPSQLLDSGHVPETSGTRSERRRELDERAERVAHVGDALALRLVLRRRQRRAAARERLRVARVDVGGRRA